MLRGPPCYSANRLQSLRRKLGLIDAKANSIYAEYVHFLHVQSALSESEHKAIRFLLDYRDEEYPVAESLETSCLVVPRIGTISPWSSKATDIFRLCGATNVVRVERGIRWYADYWIDEFTAVLHDRMTQTVIEESDIYLLFSRPLGRSLRFIKEKPTLYEGLKQANKTLGLALSNDELQYLEKTFSSSNRSPTDAELMMFAQANSEHCRHKIFNATWTVDGERQSVSLFQMIRNTYRHTNGRGILSAYRDNAAVINSGVGSRFLPDPSDGVYRKTTDPLHVLMKVETHNHPTAIAPYPGAATGSGGEIRDEGSVGRGSKPKAGLVGFTTSHLEIPEDEQPWELQMGKPGRISSALEIMLEGPIGAASFNNEYGRPAICGYFRTFEANSNGGFRWGYHKPVMIAGGLGGVFEDHIDAAPIPIGTKLIVLGGPAMLIGLGGGAASSMASGQSTEDLDFGSVQRDNAEIQRRCQEVLDTCISMGSNNPILLVHDVGAGGLSNAFPELVNDARKGGEFWLRAIPSADSGMSPMEIWCNEAQERYVLAVDRRAIDTFEAICNRERCPFAIVGEATDSGSIKLLDDNTGEYAVDVPLELLFGKPPKTHVKYKTVSRTLQRIDLPKLDINEVVRRVLRFPSVGSKKFLVTIGDRSITGLVAQEQMIGPYQIPVADAAVTIAGYDTYSGEAIAMGERSPIAVVNPSASVRMAVSEAITNLAGVLIPSLDSIVLSANWMAAAGYGQEDQALREAVESVGFDFCPQLGIAVPVGKDSLSMQTTWEQDGNTNTVISPVTLVVSAFSRVEDVRYLVTPRLSRDDSELFLLSISDRHRLGGSVLAQVYRSIGDQVPDVEEPDALKRLFETTQKLILQNLIASCHDRSDGGLFTCVLEMALAGRRGIDLALAGNWHEVLFNEEIGIVIEVEQCHASQVTDICKTGKIGIERLGRTCTERCFTIAVNGTPIFNESIKELEKLWAYTSYKMQRMRDNTECADEEYALIEIGDSGLAERLMFDPEEDVALPFINKGVRPRAAILRDQGINGQTEMAAAFHRAGFECVDVHMTDLFSQRRSLNEFKVLAACGGFSYGDVLGGGSGWAKSILLNQKMSDQFALFFEDGDTLALGVCNGCQMMSRLSSIIPGADYWPRFVRNKSEQFEARTVMVKVMPSASPWLEGMSDSIIAVPVAHGEGRTSFRYETQYEDFDKSQLLAFRFVDGYGRITLTYPLNPNGSRDGIAGVTSTSGRVLIMMPHPERLFRTIQNTWYSTQARNREDGPWMRLFRNARKALD